MAYDDRYGERGNLRGAEGGSGRDGDRGYGRDPHDQDPGAHADYYRGGDRAQRRYGPEGGFESREDYRRTERYADQGRASARGRRDERDDRYAVGGEGFDQTGGEAGGATGGYGSSGDEGFRSGGGRWGSSTTNPDAMFGGVGIAPEFSDGPRFDRQDIGSTGTHGVHPVSSRFGEAQRDPMGLAAGGGSTARARAILEQHDRQQRGGNQPQARDWNPEAGGTWQDQGRGQRQDRYAHDPRYAEWRRRHMESLDRDYHEYSTENASRFESEFNSWREKRGQQRQAVGRATEHMEVVGSDDAHVGTVDKVRGDRIILTRSDPDAGGHHHSVPCSWIERVEDKVVLNRTAEQAKQAWRDEEKNRALFEGRDEGSGGSNAMERSFSGTNKDQ